MNPLDDVLEKVSDEDLQQIQAELSPSERKSEATPSVETKTKEVASSDTASTQQVSETASSKASQKEASEQATTSASEGEKTPSSEVPIRQKKASQYIPYERFKEVNEKLKQYEQKLASLESPNRSSVPTYNELDNWGQPMPNLEPVITKKVVDTVREVIEPIVATLDEQKEKQELESALDKYPEAKQYKKEIEDYAQATNLTYDDIATLVLAKHSRPVSPQAIAKAVEESREAEISGQSNSTTKRSFAPKDLKSLSDEELESLIKEV